MLSLSGGERFPPLDLSPQRKKERTLALLLRQLRALARRQPVLMIFEDLHWIDPTSREVLDITVEKITDLPVLLVATYRPEFQPPWVGQSQVTVIALNRLGRNEGATLVARLAGNLGALPPDIVDEIVERTDGVPLFVEELTKAVVEAGADRGYVSVSAVPPSVLAVPATLHASLLGRLDRLGPAAKNVAQVGAAIGRDFSYELLAAAVQLAEPEVQEALRRLIEAGLVFQRGVPPAAEYLFKHALVQDTAYSTLLRGPPKPCIAASPRRWNSGFRNSSKPARRSSRITTAKPRSPTRPSPIGTSRATRRWPNQPCVRRSRNYAEASACWMGYPKLASANSSSSISRSP